MRRGREGISETISNIKVDVLRSNVTTFQCTVRYDRFNGMTHGKLDHKVFFLAGLFVRSHCLYCSTFLLVLYLACVKHEQLRNKLTVYAIVFEKKIMVVSCCAYGTRKCNISFRNMSLAL